jgi:hypothetical protein
VLAFERDERLATQVDVDPLLVLPKIGRGLWRGDHQVGDANPEA